MPTYQYRCTDCGTDLEAVQKFSDPALTECPTCHGQLRKVFNAVGVVFKGSGFYRTDSRPAQGSSDGPSTSTRSGDSKSGDTKSGSGDTSTSGSKGSGDGAKTPAKAASGSSGSGSSGSSGSSTGSSAKS